MNCREIVRYPKVQCIAVLNELCHLIFQVQELLSTCSKKEGGSHQGPAVLGIALIAMAEELGIEMAVRSLEQLFKYGDYNIRRAVPLALGMLYISNPKVLLYFI